jgi:hypothetical protein
MSQPFHIFLSSLDSLDIHPRNHGSDFTVVLSENICLQGEWECALLESHIYVTPPNPWYVCCDLVEESLTGDFKLPILRRAKSNTPPFEQLTYIPVKQRDFNGIRIFMRKRNNKPIKTVSTAKHTLCTLHFRPKRTESET